MPQLHRQHYADLAADAYENRIPSKKAITIGGREYKVLAVHSNPKTGYQGTVYQDVKTHEIIAAHRGTEPPIQTNRLQQTVRIYNCGVLLVFAPEPQPTKKRRNPINTRISAFFVGKKIYASFCNKMSKTRIILSKSWRRIIKFKTVLRDF